MRVVQVVDDGTWPEHCTPKETDVVIACGVDVPPGAWRRVLSVPNPEGLTKALARAIQEAGPKALNVLLPVFGECPYEPELLDRNMARLDGIVLLDGWPEPTEGTVRSFEALVQVMAPRLRGLLLSETALWRYKTLIDTARGTDDWARLIGICLEDGLRLDVRI
jgi:hypothetical protein